MLSCISNLLILGHMFICKFTFVTVHGKYLTAENFGKSCKQKLLVRKYLVNKLQSVHMANSYIFGVSVNIGEENFGKRFTICQICKFFLYQKFPVCYVYQFNTIIQYHIEQSCCSDT